MTLALIRKIYQGIADRRQMFRMFDRHAQRPNRWQGDDEGALYRGEWFEIGRAEHDHMFEILPPLWLRGDMFALREFLTGSITSVFLELPIDGRLRHFHGYCDLAGEGLARGLARGDHRARVPAGPCDDAGRTPRAYLERHP